MKKIETIMDFEKCLNADKAVVFIFFEWSGQAHFSKRVVTDWESKTINITPLFEINPEDNELFSRWVYDKVKDSYGCGSLVWLQNGNILNFEKNAGTFGANEIEVKTSATFIL